MDKNKNLLTEMLGVKSEKKKDRTSLIDYRMVPAKLSSFFSFATFGSFMPYINVFLTSVGLTPTQAGFISGLRMLVSFIIGPLWGALVDRTGRRKLIHIILGVCIILLIFPLPWIANSVGSDLITGRANHSMDLNQTGLNQTETQTITKTTLDLLRTKLFYVMLVTLMASAAFDLPMLAFQDSIVMNIINSNPRKATFGSQRVFGSVGFGLANFLAGFAADNYVHPSFSSYTAIFFVFLPVGVLTIPFGWLMINQGNWNETLKTTKSDKKILSKVFKTCAKMSNLVFLLTTFVVGIGSATNYGFTFLLMEDCMNASKSVMGLSILISSISEVVIFPFASKLFNLFGGTIPCIIIGVFSYFIRFLLISYVENPWLVLPIQMTHSTCFALFWAAAIQQVHIISPPEIAATMFSILTGLNFALSTVIGCMLGGYLYEQYGCRLFFRISSFIFLVWGIIILFYYYGIERIYKEKQKNHATQQQNEIELCENNET